MKTVPLILLLLLALCPSPHLLAQAPAATKPASENAQELAARLTSSQLATLMKLLNGATEQGLESLPGIGPVRATAIQEGRPYRQPLDLLRVPGIGDSTLLQILAHAKAGFPAEPKRKRKR